MSTNYPTTLDVFVDPAGTAAMSGAQLHSLQHAGANDAVAALQLKLGINSSADTTSVDYKLSQKAVPSAVSGRGPGQISIVDLCTAGSSIGPNASNTNLAYFTAPANMTTSQLRAIITGSAAGSATWGLYSVDAADNGTRLTTCNMATTATGAVTASWGASQALVGGNRYAISLLTSVGASFMMVSLGANQAIEAGVLPRVSGQLVGVATPTSFVAATPTNISSIFYAILL